MLVCQNWNARQLLQVLLLELFRVWLRLLQLLYHFVR